jgi:hypothetical protein
MPCNSGVAWCKGPGGPGPKCMTCQKTPSDNIGKPGGSALPAKPGVMTPPLHAKPGAGQAFKPPPSSGAPKSPILPKGPVLPSSPIVPKGPVPPRSPVAAKSPSGPPKPADSQSSGYQWLGGGMDKAYYYKAGEKFGWLEFKDSGVMDREVLAYQKLNAIVSGYLPELNTKLAPPVNVTNQKQEVVQPVRGYWIEHIPHHKTLKPKMMTMEASPQAKLIVKGLASGQKETLKRSLEVIRKNLGAIAQSAGELSIAIHQHTGQAYVLDYAANQLGQVGGADLAKTADVGIGKLLDLVAK